MTGSNPTESPSTLNAPLSIYLDLVRFLAAFSVLATHMEMDGLHADWLPLSSLGHAAVVVFFVLSGLVIATVVAERERDWRTYAVSRAVRMYSVVLPAIALSFGVTAIAATIDPSLWSDDVGRDFHVLGAVGSIAFLNESWWLDLRLPWNQPYWSLCYEVWYYVLFGVMCFARRRRRVPWMLVCAAIAGPNIIVLWPIWMLGAWMAGWRRCPAIHPAAAGCLVIGSWILVWLISWSGFDIAVRDYFHDHVPGFWWLAASQRLFTDYLIGILVAVNFIAFRALPESATRWIVRSARPIRWFSGFTFSLYLFHRPLTKLCGHFWPNPDGHDAHTLVALIAVLTSCILLGILTESRKYAIRNWLMRQPWLAARTPVGDQDLQDRTRHRAPRRARAINRG